MPDFDATELRDLPDEPNWREILDLSPTAWLERIDLDAALREDSCLCPLAQAADRQIEEGYDYAMALQAAGLLPAEHRVLTVAGHADAFIGWWDRGGSLKALRDVLMEILLDRHDG